MNQLIVNKDYEIVGVAQEKTVPCKICGKQVYLWCEKDHSGAGICDNCWEVSTRLRAFLHHKVGREMARAMMKEIKIEGRSKT